MCFSLCPPIFEEFISNDQLLTILLLFLLDYGIFNENLRNSNPGTGEPLRYGSVADFEKVLAEYHHRVAAVIMECIHGKKEFVPHLQALEVLKLTIIEPSKKNSSSPLGCGNCVRSITYSSSPTKFAWAPAKRASFYAPTGWAQRINQTWLSWANQSLLVYTQLPISWAKMK
jgi:hypothetical protein